MAAASRVQDPRGGGDMKGPDSVYRSPEVTRRCASIYLRVYHGEQTESWIVESELGALEPGSSGPRDVPRDDGEERKNRVVTGCIYLTRGYYVHV